MKLLLIAYACSPDHGSEEGVGFNFVKAVSMFSKCKVITTLENKKILEKSSLKNVEWIFIE